MALARTLVMKPRLLLDEPLSALDGVIKESIKAKIKQIVDQYNLTTIMVTHDPEEACTMSDRVLILNQGRIAQYDAPENIIEHPASDFVRDFILQPGAADVFLEIVMQPFLGFDDIVPDSSSPATV